MTYQAGKRNFRVSTGADNFFAIRFHRQDGGLVDASTLVVGDYIAYEDRIWPVWSTAPAGTGKLTIQLGHGAFYEPEITLINEAQVVLAPPAIWEVADMQVVLPDTVDTPAPSTLPVPTTIEDDGKVCLITIDQTWLEPFQRIIDYSSGHSGMSLPYDLVGMFDGLRVHVLTGSISIIRSAASPAVTPPEEVIL